MRLRKVMNLRTHLGGLFGKTSYDSIKDECDMIADLDGAGIEITKLKGKELDPTLFVGWNNVVEAQLVRGETKAEETPTKRGPGRPVGFKVVKEPEF